MKKFCKELKEHATKIFNHEKTEMIELTHREKESYKNQKVCKKRFKTNDDNKEYHKVRDHCHFTEEHSGEFWNLSYKEPKRIPVAFHNSSNYYYYFIIKELAKESEGQFKRLGENTE